MDFDRVINRCAEELLCGPCYRRWVNNPEMKIGEFCPACRPKYAIDWEHIGDPENSRSEFSRLFAKYTADWDIEEER